MSTLRMPLIVGLCVIGLGCGSGTIDTNGASNNAGSGNAGSGISTTGVSGTGGGGSVGGGAGRGGSSIIVPGGSGGGGGSGINADAACVATAMGGEQRPVALFFMMDNSGSMMTVDPGQTQTRWQLISTAVPAFLSDPTNAGIYAGLDFFPELLGGTPDAGRRGGNNGGNANASCNVADYENPNVPIAIVPGANNAQVNAFSTAITTRVVQGQTPTTPALEGAIHSATLWATAHPEMNTFVVFMTDGQPNGCMSTVANAAAAAAVGVAATPSMKTFVLGVGPDVGNLDAIAVGGGTGPTAYLVTTGGAAALTAALDAIKGTAVSCDYKVPTPANGSMIDFSTVNIQARVGSAGMASLVGNVANAAACGTGPGWYYDQPLGGPVAPTTITLCPGTCSALKSNAGSELQVLIGCKTVTVVR